MKITLVISCLRGGGAERIFARLAKAFAERGHTVAVVTLDIVHADDYVVPPAVQRIELGETGQSTHLLSGLNNNLRRLRKLRAAIKEGAPDIVLAALSETNVLAVLACQGLGIPVVISEHNDPQAFPLNRVWDTLRRYTYPQAARLVCVSQGISDAFEWLPAQQRQVIPNAIDLTEFAGAAEAPMGAPVIDKRTIVALGRLVYVKGFDLLLRAFASIAPLHPGWQLVIVGEGEERPALTSLIEELGLSGCAFLPGFFKAPHSYIRTGAFLALPSRTEGFGLVIVEAFACGLPAVAFDCPVGPRAIITDEVNGCLVPPGDVTAFAAAMNTLMQDESQRMKMAGAALSSAQSYDVSAIIPQWEHLFSALAGKPYNDDSAGGRNTRKEAA